MSVIECPQCGQRISDQASFCPQCGVRFGSVATAPGRPPEDELRIYGEAIEPQAVAVPPPGPAAPSGMLPFFPVATHKLIVLSVCSLGIYELYWAYQNWVRIRARTGEKMLPFWRAVFAPLWGFTLFRRIRQTAVAAGVPVGWSAGLVGALYLVLNMAWRLPDPWAWVLSQGTVLALLPVQLTAQRVNATQAAASTEPPNDRYTPVNILVILFGGLLLLLGVIDVLIPGTIDSIFPK